MRLPAYFRRLFASEAPAALTREEAATQARWEVGAQIRKSARLQARLEGAVMRIALAREGLVIWAGPQEDLIDLVADAVGAPKSTAAEDVSVCGKGKSC